MSKVIGTNFNMSGDAQITTAVVGNFTTTILPSSNNIGTDDPPSRLPFTTVTISNIGNRPVYIKLQPAATDNDVKGIYISRGDTRTIMSNSNVYTGEISARTQSGMTFLTITAY